MAVTSRVVGTKYRLEINADGSITTTKADESEALKYDTVGTTAYLGVAAPGTDVETLTWRIKRIVTTGDDIEITWADGNSNYDNNWKNRVNLDYS